MNYQAIRRRIGDSALFNRVVPLEWQAELSIGKLTASHLVKNLKAWRDFKELGQSQLRYVGVFASTRGGSHLISVQLHYHPRLFAVSENINSYERINYRLFLTRSVLLYDGLQNKRISQIKYMVYNKVNMGPNNTMWKPELVSTGRFKYIFYIRNPLRVVLSTHKAALARHRHELLYPSGDVPVFRNVVDMTAALLKTYMYTRQITPPGAKLLLHERFCRNYENELPALFNFVDPELKQTPRCDPKSFFKKMYCCNTRPVEVEGWLCCPNCGRNVGNGNFNVLTPVSLERTMREDLHGFFRDEDIEYFRQRLGPALSDFWLNDADHGYVDDIPHDAVEALAAPEHL